MIVKNIKIEELKPYENNPRNNEGAVEFVSNSIKEFGFQVPIVVDKENIIVAGHTRYLASKELGLKEVPCVVAENLSDEQIKAFRVIDNKTAERSNWDIKKLAEEIDGLDFNLLDFGFEQHELDVINNQEDYIDNFFEEPEQISSSKEDDGMVQIVIKCGTDMQADIESVLKENNIKYVIK